MFTEPYEPGTMLSSSQRRSHLILRPRDDVQFYSPPFYRSGNEVLESLSNISQLATAEARFFSLKM